MKPLLAHPGIETLRFYWSVYGGLPALASSLYIYLALAFTAVCWPLWNAPVGTAAWPQIAIDVVPSMLGFSMGGMAIVLAFSSAGVFKILAEDGAKDSFFIKMMAAFFHFILFQTAAILIAVAINAYPETWLSGVGFFLFSYAMLVGIATAGQLLSSARVLNFAESIKVGPEDSGGGPSA